jgi:transketolase
MATRRPSLGAYPELDALCINTLRTLSIDAVQQADSGHPGLPLGAAPMAYVLWQYHLRHDPHDPGWVDRDRFVLSAGHGSMLLYSLLHLTGYAVSLEEVRRFRQWGSKTPGHPERFLTPGVEATTGPLGQGTANAVGMAIAERALAHRFNQPGHTLIDHFTYALVSDGDLMEGVSAEAASLAGHLRLGKLIYLYDANDVSLDGPTSLTFTEDVGRRYEAYGWHVQRVERGDTDLAAIDLAIAAARAQTDRPSLVLVRTTIGFGSPNKAGTSTAHGSPLGKDEVALTKRTLGWDPAAHFALPEAALTHLGGAVATGAAAHEEWQHRHDAFARQHPALARELAQRLTGELPAGWDAELPSFAAGDKVATRVAAGKVENAIARRVPWLIGGDADLSCSTMTALLDESSFDGQTGGGKNLHFGVREHAMGAIANGLDYHGGLRPFVSTFFCFSDYMRPAVRIAALNGQPIIYVWTHDSVALGEDGPTHQPVEHLMSLRAMPNLAVVRPADAAETVWAWRFAMQRKSGPTALILSRQKLPVLDRTVFAPAEGLLRGAYVLADGVGARVDALIIATGSEVALALEARRRLGEAGVAVRVVSMPCWEAFAKQPAAYRDEVLPAVVAARVSVEAGVSLGWREHVGSHGEILGLDRYGASAPGETLLAELGFTPERVVDAVRAVIDRVASARR